MASKIPILLQVSIPTKKNYPGNIYAEIKDENGELLVSATLDYCIQWIKSYTDLNNPTEIVK